MVEADGLVRVVREWVGERISVLRETDADAPTRKYLYPHLVNTETLVRDLSQSRYHREADIALRIAALSHDIDRAFPDKEVVFTYDPQKEMAYEGQYAAYKRRHSCVSAEIVSEFLAPYQPLPSLMQKVRHLVMNHDTALEDMPDFKQDLEIVRDADRISFFNDNLLTYLTTHRGNTERILAKLRYMYLEATPDGRRIIQENMSKAPPNTNNPTFYQMFATNIVVEPPDVTPV